MSSRAFFRSTALAPTQKVASYWVIPWCTMCCRSVEAPEMRSRRVADPGNELYGVCATATRECALHEQVHHPRGVLRQQHAVGVQGEHECRLVDGQVGGAGRGPDQRQADRGVDLLVATAHQSD